MLAARKLGTLHGPGNVIVNEIFTVSGPWVCPAGVTSVCVVCVGRGGSNGGSLGWKNNITVVPGTSYDVIIDNTSSRVTGWGVSGNSGNATQGYTGDGGGLGGGYPTGGAGGYTGNGGTGTGQPGTGGGGGAGGYYEDTGVGYFHYGGGGGVGLFGQGSNGAGGFNDSGYAYGGQGGSGGSAGGRGGDEQGKGGSGAQYGGGIGHGSNNNSYSIPGGAGAVRIIAGTGRSFPNNAA